MAKGSSATESNLHTLKHLSEGLLRSAGRTGVRGNLLEIHHASAPLFDPVFLHTESEAFGVSISLTQSGGLDFGTSGGTDCSDSDGSVYPGQTDTVGDAVDNDCDGTIDEEDWIGAFFEVVFHVFHPGILRELRPFIGIEVDGQHESKNNGHGLLIEGGSSGNIIGGPDPMSGRIPG